MSGRANVDTRRTRPAASATRTTVAVLGLLAAFTGVEHGLGEITQGPTRPPGVVFESWPHVPAFGPLDGEPAMSLVPNLLATGIVAVAVAAVLGVWSVRYAARRHGGPVLVGLSVLLLLVGGGFGPPLLGILAGVLASRATAPPHARRRAVTRAMARLWPWPLVAAVGCFLGLVPGTALVYAVTGLDDPTLVGALTVGAFISTALAMYTARAHDLTATPQPPAAADRTSVASSTVGAHRRFFRVWAGVWGALVLLLFVGVTVLTLGMWLTDPAYDETTPVADLGFFAVGATIAVGLLSQLRPLPPLAGLQQALLAATSLAAAGFLSQRAEPYVGALVLLSIVAVQAWLHPERRLLLHLGRSPSPALVALALVAAVPAFTHGPRLLDLAADAGPSCFLGRCAAGDRPAELAAALFAIPLVGLLAAAKTPGWRVALWTAGAAGLSVGVAALLVADNTASVGSAIGLVAVPWAVAFIWVGEREHRDGDPRAGTASPKGGVHRDQRDHPPSIETPAEGTPMRVLVAYATRHGATAGIAERVADTLRSNGLCAEAVPVKEVLALDRYDAVVIGGAAYMYHWVKDATSFAKRHRSELRQRPVWLFSSGPLGTQPVDDEGNDVRQSSRPREFDDLAKLLHSRGERVFFGAWDPQASPVGLGERMLRHMPASKDAIPAGDFRDWPDIEAWSHEIASDLHSATTPS